MATILFGFSDNFYFSFAMLFMTGVFDNISVVIRGTLMQLLTPDAMRGRVAAVNSIFISSTNQLGAFESGIAAHWFAILGVAAFGFEVETTARSFGLVGSVVFGGYCTILVVGVCRVALASLAKPVGAIAHAEAREEPSELTSGGS